MSSRKRKHTYSSDKKPRSGKRYFNGAAKRCKAPNSLPFTMKKGSVGSTIIATSKAHTLVKRRPFLVYSVLCDANQRIGHVEAMDITTERKFFPSILANKTRGNMIVSNSTSLLINQASTIQKVTSARLTHFPDLILRRINALLYNPKNISCFLPEAVQQNTLEYRHGIVFNTVSQADILCKDPDFIALDTYDAPIKQLPFTIPKVLGQRDEVLSQKDIDDISLISRHYSEYCMYNRLSIIWPEIGTYPKWPKSFMQFVEPQPLDRNIDFSEWRQKRPALPMPEPKG